MKLRFVRTSSISGRVLGSDGSPELGVSVGLLRYSRNLGERVLVAYMNVSTNPRGEYRLTGMEAGEFYLAVSRPLT